MRRFMWLAVGVLVGALLVGGGVALADTPGGPWDNDVQDQALVAQNATTNRLIHQQPAYQPKYSVERQNLNRRYKTYSDPNKVSYIALTTLNGGIVYTGVIKGKVSAVSSQLSPANRVQCVDGGDGNLGCSTIDVPEPDGSWATNGDGVFWFDDKGVYHEWNGTYMVADQPFTLTQPPLLTIGAEAR